MTPRYINVRAAGKHSASVKAPPVPPTSAFLNHMAVTFVILVAVMTVISLVKPLPEPVSFAKTGEVELEASPLAKWVGLGVVVATIALYVIFW